MLNTTSSAQTVQMLDINPQNGSVRGVKNGTINANSFSLLIGGDLVIAGFITLQGSFRIQADGNGLLIEMNASFTLGAFGSMQTVGGALITSSGHLVLSIEISRGLSLGPISMEGIFTLQINTSNQAATIAGTTVAARVASWSEFKLMWQFFSSRAEVISPYHCKWRLRSAY